MCDSAPQMATQSRLDSVGHDAGAAAALQQHALAVMLPFFLFSVAARTDFLALQYTELQVDKWGVNNVRVQLRRQRRQAARCGALCRLCKPSRRGPSHNVIAPQSCIYKLRSSL